MRCILAAIAISLFTLSCVGTRQNKSHVVATNAWTAAFARAAGVENVVMLAPFEMQHPVDYEIRTGDISRISDASLIIYANYERVIKQLMDGLGVSEAKQVSIETRYDFETLQKSVMKIAAKTGTMEKAAENLTEIEKINAEAKRIIKEKGLDKMPVAVHFFQQPIAEELELNIVAVFGPAPLEAKQIASLAKSGVTSIIDNKHGPVGKPIREVLPKAKYIALLNFPGKSGTITLADVIRFNLKKIIEER